MFVSKGFSDAEDLADTVISRVMKKLPEIRDTYVGEPARYFHGVARNIMRETARRKEVAAEVTPVFLDDLRPQTDEYDCLVKCLRFLPSEKRELILDYYIYDGRDKIVHHQQMATELGISEGALRGRAHHLRSNLERCIHDCLQAERRSAGSCVEQKPV
jgi:RNA polymerase sigma factor (sigma-70 family)